MTSYKFPGSSVSGGALKETVLCGILQLLAVIAVGLRLYARRMQRKKLQFNDYAILVALFFCASLLAIAITSTLWSGKGFHTHDIDPAYRSRVFVAFTAGQPVWAAANTFVKFSILQLYLTIFQDVRFRRVCYGVLAFSMCYFISVFLETFLICKPVRYNWDKTIEGTCSKHALQTYLVAGILNLLIDVVIVCMPMPLLFRLTIPTAKKLGLIAMFSLGAVICIVSLLRVIYISRMDMHDFSYTYADLGMWSIVEPQLGIVNACLPVMRPLLRRVAKTKMYRLVFGTEQSNGSLQISLESPRRHDGGQVRKLADPMDQLYPLDTVHLVGSSTYSGMDSQIDLERAASGPTHPERTYVADIGNAHASGHDSR